jgi:hypothetical protein
MKTNSTRTAKEKISAKSLIKICLYFFLAGLAIYLATAGAAQLVIEDSKLDIGQEVDSILDGVQKQERNL